MYLIDPALLIALACSQRVYFRDNTHHTGYDPRLWLCAGHASETSSHEKHSFHVLLRSGKPFRLQLLAGSVHDGDCGSMDNALRPDVHIGAGSHLSVLRDSEGVEFLPVILFGIIRDDHAVRDDDSRSILMAREKSERVARIHHKSLFVCHFRKILHHKAVLCPVLENGSVSAIGYKLMRMLSHTVVKVILYHGHDSGSLTGLGRIFLYRTGIHLIVRTETIHVYTAVCFEFRGKFRCQNLMMLLRKIAQGVLDCKHFLPGAQYVFALGGMIYCRVIWLWSGQFRGNACQYFLLECIIHLLLKFYIVLSGAIRRVFRIVFPASGHRLSVPY